MYIVLFGKSVYSCNLFLKMWNFRARLMFNVVNFSLCYNTMIDISLHFGGIFCNFCLDLHWLYCSSTSPSIGRIPGNMGLRFYPHQTDKRTNARADAIPRVTGIPKILQKRKTKYYIQMENKWQMILEKQEKTKIVCSGRKGGKVEYLSFVIFPQYHHHHPDSGTTIQ